MLDWRRLLIGMRCAYSSTINRSTITKGETMYNAMTVSELAKCLGLTINYKVNGLVVTVSIMDAK